MPVSDFKFVSPGVFVNEIDNSFRPRQADTIGPVVIGRATRGMAMQPIKIESYSEFVETFGDTVPGSNGGDVYRNGNYQSPMYATYAARAFLNSNVAPLTFIRLLGQETTAGSAGAAGGAAGWKTDKIQVKNGANAGGAYGLFVAQTSSAVTAQYTSANAFELAAVIYVQSGSVMLSGAMAGPVRSSANLSVKASSTAIESDSNGRFKVVVNGNTNGEKVFEISLDEDDQYYIRDQMSTNPLLASTAGAFYPTTSYEDYWLGETYEQEMRDNGLTSGNLVGVIAGIASGSNKDSGPHNMKSIPSQEAIAGWFIGQDTGPAGNYQPFNAKKLFRLIGRGHGEWLHKNAKVSIERIKQSNSSTSDYGTFSIVIRNIYDRDPASEILERFDNCTLDPTSPNYVAKVVGDKFYRWDSTNKTLKEYGSYENLSRYVRVEMDDEIEQGAAGFATLLPFGYYGPPKLKNISAFAASGSVANDAILGKGYVAVGAGLPGYTDTSGVTGGLLLSSSWGIALTASFNFPSARLRADADDNGLSNQKDAYFGFDVTETTSTTPAQLGIFDTQRLWLASMGQSTGVPQDNSTMSIVGVDGFSYIFSMDDVSGSNDATGVPYTYTSGSRNSGTSYTAVNGYEELLNQEINKFTAPFWGGFDGLDITKPDPFYNAGLSSATENNNYAYHTLARAIDTVSDPEYINMNLLSVPGLTNDKLTTKMIDVCEQRGDALALIDLANVYKPAHEEYNSDRTNRIGTTPLTAANNLKNRKIDSSYGATFYPWVQTKDRGTGQNVWVPPTVAMMGVLASSEAASEIWFAPAGFNRGGLSEGFAAGIPITNVSERLSSSDRDTLYDARINPIAKFPSEGIVVFGQKTLQERPSALDRINVRRLVIFLKKQISILSSQVLFEQNVQSTWNNFKSLIEPLLESVKSRSGITDFRLFLDETTTTPDLIDQNVLYAKIMVKPARAIEYIAIDFVIASSGASFDD